MAAVFLRHLAHQRHAVAMPFAGTGAGQAVVPEQNLSLVAVAAVNPQPLPREFHAEGQQLGLVLAYGSGYHGVVQQIGQIGGQVQIRDGQRIGNLNQYTDLNLGILGGLKPGSDQGVDQHIGGVEAGHNAGLGTELIHILLDPLEISLLAENPQCFGAAADLVADRPGFQ